MRSPDEPKYTELLSDHQGVVPSTLAPSRRARAVCATSDDAPLLGRGGAAQKRWWRVVQGRWAGGRPSAGGEPLQAGPPGLAGGMDERGASPELLRGSGRLPMQGGG